MADSDNNASEEHQLKQELEQICTEYQELVLKSQDMAPKDANTKKIDPSGESNVNDDEFEGLFS